MELEYIEDIKNDVIHSINKMIKYGGNFKSGIAYIVSENDYYLSDEAPIDRDCHYISIGVYAVETNNIEYVDIKIKKEIKRSVEVIKLGKYDKYFTEEDKKYIYEDIKTIENSDLLK